MLNDCIAALSTAPGAGAIAIVRMSGAGCLKIADSLFRGDGVAGKVEKRSLFVGRLFDPDTGDEIDKVVLMVFRGPGSYSGEDMVEICCHGGRYAPMVVLDACLRNGARAAEPGEFTKRAYLNGKLDLLQAEGVAEIVAATTAKAHRLAVDQLDRVLSGTLSSLREQLKELVVLLEYEIDFPGEGECDMEEMRVKGKKVRAKIEGLLATWREGLLSTEGAVVVIAGLPNVGKSSLFNLMSRRTRSIVTPHPGTTRDAIEQEISLSGLLVRLVDTAGLRETNSDVERLGVEVSRNYLAGADLVLFLIDATREQESNDRQFLQEIEGKEVIRVVNKIDLLDGREQKRVGGRNVVRVSTKTGEGFEALRNDILHALLGMAERQGPAITTLRQKRGLGEALVSLDRWLAAPGEGKSAEYIVEDLRSSMSALEELTGIVTSEEILDEIFSRFCVGK